MKVSREQAAQNRQRIVEMAGQLFRERGYNGIGVADLMKSAGLTHGGFYGNFKSKEDLLVEACQHALLGSKARFQRSIEDAATPADGLDAITAAYLSAEHCANPGDGCAMATLGPDVARLSGSARHAFTAGARDQIDVLAGLLQNSGQGMDAAAGRRQAIEHTTAMIGAVVLARAVDDAALSDEILQVVADALKAARS